MEDFDAKQEQRERLWDRLRKLPISELLNETSDEWVCDELNTRIGNYYGNDTPLTDFVKPARVVSCVVLANGIIRNGGFQYLFESNFHGDPGYVHTIAAFTTIGANKAASAFKCALALFAGSKLPMDLALRLKQFHAVPKSKKDEIDRAFWDGDDEIWSKLANYVRANSGAFLFF